jgi:hypothetical protein
MEPFPLPLTVTAMETLIAKQRTDGIFRGFGIFKENGLDKRIKLCYNIQYINHNLKTEPKSCDEDSSFTRKWKASRGRWKPDAKYREMKIPSELRAERAMPQ